MGSVSGNKKKLILRYWSPVVTPSPFSVRVEGFVVDLSTTKTNSDAPYRSTSIAVAVEERLLKSKSGTAYILDGPVYREECRRKRIPEHIINKFENGFPLDFEDILLQWVTGRSEATVNARRSTFMSVYNYDDQSQTPFRTAKTDNTRTVIELKDWCIRFMPDGFFDPELSPFNCFGISLQGVRFDTGEKWQSCEILDVLSAREIRGSHCNYALVGPINTKLAAEFGFSPEFIRHFKYGFPNDWQEFLPDYYEEIKPPQECSVENTFLSTDRNSFENNDQDDRTEQKPNLQRYVDLSETPEYMSPAESLRRTRYMASTRKKDVLRNSSNLYDD